MNTGKGIMHDQSQSRPEAQGHEDTGVLDAAKSLAELQSAAYKLCRAVFYTPDSPPTMVGIHATTVAKMVGLAIPKCHGGYETLAAEARIRAQFQRDLGADIDGLAKTICDNILPRVHMLEKNGAGLAQAVKVTPFRILLDRLAAVEARLDAIDRVSSH